MQRVVVLLAALALVVSSAPDALAIPEFQKAFEAKYVEKHPDSAFKELVKEAKCFVCHQGKSKKNHNSYGLLIKELIGKKDKKDDAKIDAAFEEVGAKHSKTDDAASPTFAELIKQGKLPGGELDDLKKEPAGQ